MSFLTAIPILGKIVDKALGVVDELVEDKDLANRIKAAVQQQISAQDHQELIETIQAQASIIKAEAQGESWLQRNWRPLLMLVVVVIVANNYVFYPYFSLFTDKVQILDLPDGLWNLMQIGVGGYVVGRSAEKGIQRWRLK